MAESEGSVPVTGAAPTGPAPTAAGDVGVPASAGPGDAPGPGGDALATGEAAPPAETPPKYRFLNREFDDQKRAEEAIGAEVGRSRTLQKEVNTLKQQMQQRESELQALRSMLGGLQGTGKVPGVAGSQDASAAPLSFADELAKSGELELFAKIAQDESMGPGHMAYAMAQAFDKHFESKLNKAVDSVRSGIAEMQSRGEMEKATARALTAAQKLYSEYPELDDTNQSDEAEAAREAVLETLQSTPLVWTRNAAGEFVQVPQGSVWLAQQPEAALRWAANEVRRQHGVPVFAQAPGSSGSPSARAAAAAEKIAAASGATPIDGTGVPKQKPGDAPETLADKWRRDRQTARRQATTPSGRPLGFVEGGA